MHSSEDPVRDFDKVLRELKRAMFYLLNTFDREMKTRLLAERFALIEEADRVTGVSVIAA